MRVRLEDDILGRLLSKANFGEAISRQNNVTQPYPGPRLRS